MEKDVRYKNRWHRYQAKIHGNFGIKEGDNVLDVGCGYDTIFPLANHCIDPYIDKKEMEKNPLMMGKAFWQCGLTNLDWPDKKYHFIYASHVMEHMTDPDAACKELIRLGQRGYIECPTRLTESLFGDQHHLWIIENREGILTFKRMTPEERMHPFGDFFYRIFHYELDHEPVTSMENMIWKFHQIKAQHPRMFYTMYPWNNSFKWKVIE